MSVRNAEKGVPKADGYDWLLNRCVDIEQADHAGHLDDAVVERGCAYCYDNAGRKRLTPPGSDQHDGASS